VEKQLQLGFFCSCLRHGRQVHLYSGIPGRPVWAQSRQTNRPSLNAIIGLNSVPTLQWGQRITRVVSVAVQVVPIRKCSAHWYPKPNKGKYKTKKELRQQTWSRCAERSAGTPI